MPQPIFRQATLDRMANPERLDSPVRLVGRPKWLILAAIVGAIAVALAWVALTRAPIKVSANGILINRAGLVEIVAGESGQLLTLSIAPGDIVVEGQSVATLARSELQRELGDEMRQLAAAEDRLARVRTFYEQQESREFGAERERLTTIRETQSALRAQLDSFEEKAQRVADLVEQGYLPRDTLIQAQIELADARERFARLGEEGTSLAVNAAQRESRASLALLDEQRNVDEHRGTVERLRSRFTEQQSVRATGAGQVVELRVAVGDVVNVGSAIATLAPIDQEDAMQAILYVPAGQGKRIGPGMYAEIVPSTVERQRYGHIAGRVTSVAPLPATAAGMRRVLRNDELVDQLRAGGAPIEVRVALERDPETATGFRWSSSRGPSGGTSIGTLVEGRVVVGHQPVIAWLIPGAAAGDD